MTAIGSRSKKGLRIVLSLGAILVVVICVLFVACSHTRPDATIYAPLPAAAEVPISADVLDERGQVVDQSPIEIKGAQNIAVARRATYRSVSGPDGSSSLVGGSFFLPTGREPPGGWPIVAFAHGTTGIEPGCAPSEYEDLRGYSPVIGWFLARGYAVAATDYAGLAQNTGTHLMLEPRSAAYNVIDSVRALRAIYPNVSNSWLAYGESQGGQAVWAANQYASAYGADLALRGVVSVAPAANITALAELANAETLEASQRGAYPLVVAGLSRSDPSVKVDDFIHGKAAAHLKSILSCGANSEADRSEVTDEDLKPSSDLAAATLREALRRIALPQLPLTAPMLVVYGSEDYTIFPDWVAFAVRGACALGGQVQSEEIDGMGHGDTAQGQLTSDWIFNRFAGAPVQSNCG